MKIDVEQIAPCGRRLTIEVPADSINRELGRHYQRLQKRVKLPGFRPGKVPRRVLEHHYRHSVEQEVLQKLVPEALSEALTKENLRTVGEPQIDQMELARDHPLRFVATVQVLPDFEIGDYDGWEFERRIPEVTEADVDAALARLGERHAVLEAVSGRPVQTGDFVIVDYRGSLEGRPLAGLEQRNMTLEVGSSGLLPEIEHGLVGMEEGTEKTIEVRFPADHQEPVLAAKTVQFWVKLREIKTKILPDLDDEFARAYGEADSLAALRERLRRELEAAARQRADGTLRRDILAKLVSENPIDVPEILVEREMRRLYLQQRRQETGREPTEADSQVDLDGLREAFAEPALENVRGQLILYRLGEVAGVTVTADEVDAEVAALASRMAQNSGALKQAMERNGALSALEASLREQKIFEMIMANVQIADKTVGAEEATREA